MLVSWKYGMIFFNTFLIFGYNYSAVLPTGVQHELMDSPHHTLGSNNTGNQTGCTECLGLGEVRYNLLFSTMRWTSAVLCLPSGYLIDKLGNSRSAILLTALTFLGSIMFAIGTSSHGAITIPMYLLMVAGRGVLAFGEGTLRLIQTRVVTCYFRDSTLIPMAFGSIGYIGESLSYYISPNMAVISGLRAFIWLGAVASGFSFLCAVGLVLLLQMQMPREADSNENTELPTVTDIKAMPKKFWLFILTLGLLHVPWICKQANLPDYLELRFGYTMTEAGYITGVFGFITMSTPILCAVVKYIDCHGVVLTAAVIWMTSLYVLLGFWPAINPLILAVADGIGTSLICVIVWQLLIIISPANFVGTFGGLMYLVRHIATSLIFLAAGYILDKPEKTNRNASLKSYQYFFLILVLTASTCVILTVVMNILDFREACVFNSRIGRWRKDDEETIELMSGNQTESRYSEPMNNNSN